MRTVLYIQSGKATKGKSIFSRGKYQQYQQQFIVILCMVGMDAGILSNTGVLLHQRHVLHRTLFYQIGQSRQHYEISIQQTLHHKCYI